MDTLDFDVQTINELLEAARKRVRSGQKAIKSKLKPEQYQTRYYGLFEDSLTVAGLSKALSKPEAEIRKNLKIAAQAAVGIFKWQHTTVGKITYMPNYDEEVFIDNTAANPWTYIRAIYAALAAETPQVLKTLADYNIFEQDLDRITVAPILQEYCQILRSVILGEMDNLSAQLHQFIAKWSNDRLLDTQYWLIQGEALLALVENNASDFEEALENVALTLTSYYSTQERQDNPIRFLHLPVLGLRALGQDLMS